MQEFAPEVPLAAWLGTGAVLVVLVAWQATGGQVVQWVASNTPTIRIDTILFGTIDVFGWFKSLLNAFDNAVTNLIGSLVQANEWSWDQTVRWNAYAWQELSGLVSDVTQGTEQTIGWLWRHKVPLLIGIALGPLSAALGALQTAFRALPRTITHYVQPIYHVAYRTLPGTITRVEHVVTRVAVPYTGAIARDIPRLWEGIDDAEGEARKAWRLAKANVNRLSVAALAGVVAAALLRHLDLGWTRCRGVNRVGKSLCGISGLIESLFLDAVEALALQNLCWIMEAATVAAAPISAVITEYGDGLNAFIHCRGIRQSSGPALTTTALPTPYRQLTFGRSAP